MSDTDFTNQGWLVPTLYEVSKIMILILAFTMMVALTARYYLDLPEVHVDANTRQCVRVEPVEAGDCDLLPKKYTVVLVKSSK